MAVSEKVLSSSMNARTVGSGNETIVLAHGFGGDQSLWDKINPSLAKHYQVLSFDWCFSGAVQDKNLFDPAKYSTYDAYADDLIALLDEWDLKSVIFLGHSMSGMIGCIASIKRPELFQRLILLLASPRYLNLGDYVGGFEESRIDDMVSSIRSNYQEWVENFTPAVVDPKDPPSVDKFRRCLHSMKPEVAASLANAIFHSDYRHILADVTTPCTIIQVTNDMAVPTSVAHYMKEKISGLSTVEMIEGTGHFPQLTAHKQLLDVLHQALGFDAPSGEDVPASTGSRGPVDQGCD
ncbi:strigolactone esterase D14-like [Syzygium oleosum]|uniref:strigolactone esterase D14-like n=1 Tax=Syzygium oleosum TaxID=219896 RepID=UPI0024BA015A|nr:strigolactone esterase D14-like [Syzygium oleosum]